LELAEQRTTNGGTINPMLLREAGGAGSGNFGHSGRPGMEGGSGKGGVSAHGVVNPEEVALIKALAEKEIANLVLAGNPSVKVCDDEYMLSQFKGEIPPGGEPLGMYDRKSNTIYVRGDISRDNVFTVAKPDEIFLHELGHAVQGHAISMTELIAAHKADLKTMDKNDAKRFPRYTKLPREAAAQAFAVSRSHKDDVLVNDSNVFRESFPKVFVLVRSKIEGK
jgi:hypothetical protein